VTFYYGGTTALAGADPEQLATTLGRPAIVVTRGRRRFVDDVYSGPRWPVTACVTKVHVDLSGWSGQPLRYSRHPW
jgi:hypothetical protein